MTFLEQINFIIKDIKIEIEKMVGRIRSNKWYGITPTIIVVTLTSFLAIRYSMAIASIFSSLVSVSVALALSFYFTIFKENRDSKEKINELSQRMENFEGWSGLESDETIRKIVDQQFVKRLS